MLCTQVESHLLIQGRIGYILNNLLAILNIIKGDITCATEQLKHNMKLIHSCGNEYHHILQHNLKNINYIKKIDWYFLNKVLNPDTYYLDIRIW